MHDFLHKNTKLESGKSAVEFENDFQFHFGKGRNGRPIFLFLKFEKPIHENDRTENACRFCKPALHALQAVQAVPVPVSSVDFARKCTFSHIPG